MPLPLRIVSFNIAHGRGLTPIQGFTSARKIRVNLRKIAVLLEQLQPDVVCLQEVDECSRWAGNFDHLDYLREFAGFPFAVFGIHNRREGMLNLSYGNAILSRWPILVSETVTFGQRRVGEKGFLFTEILAEGREIPLVNLHLHYRSRTHRFRQVDQLVGFLNHKHEAHGQRWACLPIICGDLNNPSHRPDATAALLEHVEKLGPYQLHPATTPTYPSPSPIRALDFVFVPPNTRDIRSRVERCILSDHRPVVVDLTLPARSDFERAAGN